MLVLLNFCLCAGSITVTDLSCCTELWSAVSLQKVYCHWILSHPNIGLYIENHKLFPLHFHYYSLSIARSFSERNVHETIKTVHGLFYL